MEHEQLKAFAEVLTANIPAEDAGEFFDVLFEQVEFDFSPADVKIIADQLLTVGVDIRPICKRKHPA
jgi:hypothetical protein